MGGASCTTVPGMTARQVFPPLQRHEGAGTTIPLIHKGEADGLLPALPRNAVPGDCPPGAGLSADHHPVM